MGEELFDVLAPAVAPLGLELVDVELRPGTVKVVVDRPGGADLEVIARATTTVSALLDHHDPMPGKRYTLEVSSPGVERPLRRAEDYVRAVGETVTVRTTTGGEGERRVRGCLVAADGEGFVLEADDLPDGGRRFSYRDVERARTVFEWGGQASPSSGAGGRGRRRGPRPMGAGGKRVTS